MKYQIFLISILPILPGTILFTTITDATIRNIILISYIIAIISFILTYQFIPIVAQFTRSKGLSGKDLGKKGTANEHIDIPESLGLVCGIVFLIATILTQLLIAQDQQHKLIFNSALFSICFMIFLGFIDDVLDLKWRYKLILPTIASLPLLSSYSGSTAVYIPKPLASILMNNNGLTRIGKIINIIATVDTQAHGNIVELGYLFLIFMGLLAVFCTNAINILAG